MSTPSDLGYDPIIPLTHDTFMDHSPSGPVNLLDPSRTSLMKTSKSFPNSGIGLSLYESYSPDHSGSPHDTPDPIRDSEQHSVSLLTFISTKQHRILKCVSLRFVNYADMTET